MSTTEVTRDMPSHPLAPVDDSVVIPPSVKRAQAVAEAAHAAAYGATEPEASATPVTAPVTETPVAPVTAVTPPAPPADPITPQPDPNATVNWEHRYHAMKGRYEKTQQTVGSLQEQMSELGNELVRTQQAQQMRPVPQAPVTQPLVTPQDVENYGTELLDVIARRATEVVAPQLTKLEQENENLRKRLVQNDQRGIYAQLNAQVPSWREINTSPAFKTWLSKRDVYSGQVRQGLLNAAFQAAKAPTVIAFFRGYLQETGGATSTDAPVPQPQPQAQTPAPRQAAVALETLTAPGRPRPASGSDAPQPADQQVFTRALISKFYSDVRRGAYANNMEEKNRVENAIFRAQSEGRVRG